jgi:hypothetical protein
MMIASDQLTNPHGAGSFLEKTSLARLLKNFASISRNAKFHCRIYKNSPLFPIQSLINLIDTVPFYFSDKKNNSMVWVRERTIPTERPPLVGEVNANFCE